jgi:DNA-directed RNA polymerase sigma subunit (sigma70/sigma32)
VTILRERVLASEPASLRTLATRVSLSTERVRQIEVTLRTAIRTALDADCMDVAA